MMKMFLSLRFGLLLALLLTVSMAGNAQFFYDNGICYETYDGEEAFVVSNYDGGYQGVVSIPETVTAMIMTGYDEFEATMTVVGIASDAFRDCDQLTDVILPNTLRQIDRNAFYGCTSLNNIALPASLLSIGQSAFAYCTSFTSIVIPNSVRYIDWNAFYCCTGLNSVTISNSVTDLDGTFFGCTGLTSVEIPGSVTSLDGTFTGCTGLTSMNIPASVNYIGAKTFEGCSALISVVLPSTLTYIAQQAFFNCENLQSITCLAVAPPSMYTYNSECFDYETYLNGLLSVPTASIQRYQSTDWWSLFQHIQGLMTLNVNSLRLETGRTFRLVTYFATGFNPSSPISWQSSNTGIATVSADGLIRAIAEGEAFIYASVEGEEVACEVTVIAGEIIPGDIDGDGMVGISDITALIDLIMSGTADPALYDVDGDGIVGISDVTAIIDMILYG